MIDWFGWRAANNICGFFGLTVGIIGLIFVAEPPRDNGEDTDEGQEKPLLTEGNDMSVSVRV